MPLPFLLRNTLIRLALALLVAGLALYGGALAWLWIGQEKLLFVPDVLPADQPLAKAPDIHEVSVEVAGARLHALHLRLPDPKGVVFFLHGNAGSLANWFVNPDYYRRVNFDLFMLDYRGFGKSTGRICMPMCGRPGRRLPRGMPTARWWSTAAPWAPGWLSAWGQRCPPPGRRI
jgi:hypothetical protein